MPLISWISACCAWYLACSARWSVFSIWLSACVRGLESFFGTFLRTLAGRNCPASRGKLMSSPGLHRKCSGTLRGMKHRSTHKLYIYIYIHTHIAKGSAKEVASFESAKRKERQGAVKRARLGKHKRNDDDSAGEARCARPASAGGRPRAARSASPGGGVRTGLRPRRCLSIGFPLSLPSRLRHKPYLSPHLSPHFVDKLCSEVAKGSQSVLDITCCTALYLSRMRRRSCMYTGRGAPDEPPYISALRV